MRSRWSAALIFAAALAGPASAEGPFESGKVYRGPEGLEVAVVPLSPRADGKALVQVTASGTELDGKAFLVAVEERGDSADYRGKLHGRSWNLLYARRGRWEVSVPGRRDGVAVGWDEKRTRELKSEEVYQRWKKQSADGTLAAIERFDRPAETARVEKQLAETADAFRKACDTKAAVKIDWAGISDEVLMQYSVSSYCGEVLSAMGSICDSKAGKRAVATSVKEVVCRFGAALGLEVGKGGTLTWTTATDSSNLGDYARAHLESDLGGGGVKGASPFQDPSLRGQIFVEKTVVCSDGKSHYVVVAPDESSGHKLYTGDGKTLAAVPAAGGRFLPGEDFLDPRYVNKTANPSFRGFDMRLYGSVSTDGGKCAVRCGERSVDLRPLDAEAARSLLGAAKVVAPLQTRAPYAMARDEHGNYYFVDRGNTPETEKNFRLFVGPKGNLKLQKMTNVVSDSEGEIFSTKTGSLRFILSKGERTETLWIQNAARKKLLQVKVDENLPLIYTELGVYAGQRLGTPCDDL